MPDDVTAPNTDDLLAQHWPMPESYTQEHLAAAMRMARELIRWTNHATLNNPADTMPFASDAGYVAQVLAEMTAGMSQLAYQVGARVVDIAQEPDLRHDSGGNAKQTTREAAGLLGDASQGATGLSGVFTQAWNKLARIGHDITD